MSDDLHRNLAGGLFAFEQVGDADGHVAAEDLKRIAFDAQTFDIGRLDVLHARLVIVGGFDNCNAHGQAPLMDRPTLPRRPAPQKQAINSRNTQPIGLALS